MPWHVATRTFYFAITKNNFLLSQKNDFLKVYNNMKLKEEYKRVDISKKLIEKIQNISKQKIRIMEVCGTHTTSIFKHGIKSLLPSNISLISGPGCPVCVTAMNEIDAFIELSKKDGVILTTFGDLMRVPGSKSSLSKEKAKGKDIRIVASPLDAVDIAKKNPDKKIVFLGVGFETTAPAIAGSIVTAKLMNINNYFVYAAHKILPPALDALMNTEAKISAFMLPGHVSMIIGETAYIPFFEKYKIPCVIAGFEPVDILYAVFMIVSQIETNAPKLENAYQRAVSFDGNKKAKEFMDKVFKNADTNWRGIGEMPESGLKIKDEFSHFDAEKVFDIKTMFTKEPKGCSCGDVLTGVKTPPECALYKKVCNPQNPIGPCMVSSEGSCAAYFKYYFNDT
jgi:hydrogenase expression/formation protein HypD